MHGVVVDMKVLRKVPPTHSSYLFITCDKCASLLMLGNGDVKIHELPPHAVGYRKFDFTCGACEYIHTEILEYKFIVLEATSALLYAVQAQLS